MADSKGVYVKVLGGGREVGRLSVLVGRMGEKEGVLVDSGINFDDKDRPVFASTYPPRYVKAAVLSHAHLDHVGTLPMYYISEAPRAYATRLTSQVAKIILEDFLKLNGYYSPYEHNEVERLLENTEYVRYGQKVEVDGVEVAFYSAGHIPGSVFTVINIDGVRVGVTGDINTIETKLMKPAQLDHIGKLDILVTEATYGSTTHPPRSRAEERLVAIIEETLDQGGTVLIPAFSIARGQEIMMILAERGLGVPVYVDGMIRQVTEAYLENSEYINNPNLLRRAYEEFTFVRGWRERNEAWRKPGVIIASAGMLKGGPSLYYLKRIGGNPKNSVILVSFQAPGSVGRRLLEEGLMPTEEPLSARLEWLDFSSHADSRGLLTVVNSTRPSRILVVHSEYDVAVDFAEKVKRLWPDTSVDIAENEKVYEYSF